MTGVTAAGPVTLATDLASVQRVETVRPAMCGHNSLFVGQIGDWTWDAVSVACDTDVLRAQDPSGAPTYLSFYYYRVRGGRRVHLRTPTFGDRITVTSRVFGFGSESVLTLHRIALGDDPDLRPIDPDEFYAAGDDDGRLYVENFNRWITRAQRGSNEQLARSSPVNFRHEHLPALPERYSPRLACHRARTAGTFTDGATRARQSLATALTFEYSIDPSRDLNGVGLLYFAAYFSIVDSGLLRLWRELGRDDRSFLDRVVSDQRLCYLGNADAGSVLRIDVRHWRGGLGGARETVDVVLRDNSTDRLLAVSTLHLLSGGQP